MKIAVFHYHLHPGGVTRAISLALRILLPRLEEVEEITVVTGDRENAEAALPEEARGKIRLAVHPEIGYLRGESHTDARRIKTRVLEKYRGYLWWIHNYHLGKNPLFTQAVVETAEEDPNQRILLHIHDFPECSRYENLAYLKSLYPGVIYPLVPNVRYVCINRRDYSFLRRAGIPERMVRLLNNPLTEETPPTADGSVKTLLEKEAPDRFGGYLPGRPLLVYPVRSIRRKNVLETGLISRLIPGGVNVAVTLPGVSDQEAGYSRMVDQAFTEGTVHGVFGTGARDARIRIDLRDLIGACDAVLSTSVLEGFGYLFVNALQWGKRLAARRLDILEGMNDLFDPAYHRFYDTLEVPRSRKQQEETRRLYENYLGGLETYLGRELIETVLSDMKDRFTEDSLDFSYLSPDEQRGVLDTARDSGYLASVRKLNSETTKVLETVCCSFDAGNDSGPEPVPLPEGFGPSDFTRAFREILVSFDGPGTAEHPANAGTGASDPADSIPAAEDVEGRMLESFASPPFLRLLFDS
jgi:hypothetical protein